MLSYKSADSLWISYIKARMTYGGDSTLHNAKWINNAFCKPHVSPSGVVHCRQEFLTIHGECICQWNLSPVHAEGPRHLVLRAHTWWCTTANDVDWNSPSDKHVICHVAQKPSCHWGLVLVSSPQVCAQSGYLLTLNEYSETAGSVFFVFQRSPLTYFTISSSNHLC